MSSADLFENSNGQQPARALPEFEPIGDRVVIQRQRARASKGGILYPDAHAETKAIGTIIAVGPGAMRGFRLAGEDDRCPMQAKVGDVVIMPIGAQIVKLDESDEHTEICICQEHQLLAILRPKQDQAADES